MQLRPATMRDSDELFSWRNDPVTRAAFRSTLPVPRENHDHWMQFNVQNGYPQHRVLIAESDYGNYGVVRFDAARDDVMVYEVSITLAPRWRGKGLAATILDDACALMTEFTLKATIRTHNDVSRRLFERCGFRRMPGGDDQFVYYRKEAAP